MFSSDQVNARGAVTLEAVRADPSSTLLALDFDGTLSPIIDEPELAVAQPGAIAALDRLGRRLAKVAVVTGRPVETARRLGRFDGRPGLSRMTILGQYGVERWDAESGAVRMPPPPAGIEELKHELDAMVAVPGLDGAWIEDKGRALVVHTRKLSDPDAALERLHRPVRELAGEHGMTVDPGKDSLEIRQPGTDKGDAIRVLVAETQARQVIFGGDDLGDLPAFDAVDQLRDQGVAGLLLASAPGGDGAIAERADLILDGPGQVADWLTWLADELDD